MRGLTHTLRSFSASLPFYNRTETFDSAESLFNFVVSGSPELLLQWLVAALLGVWSCAVTLLLVLPTEYHESSLGLKAAHTKFLDTHQPRCSYSRFVGRSRGRLCVVRGFRTERRFQSCTACACCRFSGRRRLRAVRARCRDRVWRQLYTSARRLRGGAAKAVPQSGPTCRLPSAVTNKERKGVHGASQDAGLRCCATGVFKGKTCKSSQSPSAL